MHVVHTAMKKKIHEELDVAVFDKLVEYFIKNALYFHEKTIKNNEQKANTIRLGLTANEFFVIKQASKRHNLSLKNSFNIYTVIKKALH